MRNASGYIAVGLILFLFIGRSIQFDIRKGEYLLNSFWSGVIVGFLLALFIFNFYLGYIDKDIIKRDNKKS